MLQTCVEDCTQDILALHTTISGLIVTIATLCRDLDQAMMQFGQKSSRRSLCQNILSPVKYINHDVLEKVFLECWDNMGSDRPNPLKPPLQLASVCHRWRHIAYSIPRLWNNIRVHATPRNLVSSLRLATKWLERARSNPNVSMILYIPAGTAIDFPPLADFLGALSTSPIQIKRLAFQVGKDTPLDDVKSLDLILEGRCAGLEELKIGPGGLLDQTLIIEGVKRLYLVRIPEIWLTTSPTYKGLTVLRLVVGIHWDVFEWILVSCISLERVLVAISPVGATLTQIANSQFQKLSWRSSPPDNASSKITIPHLVYLGISNDAQDIPDIPRDFLTHFIFPSLRIFEYYAEEELGSSLGWLTSLAFLGQLRRVTLQLLFEVPKETLMQFFSSTTSVEELSVYVQDYDDNLVSLLTGEVPSTPDLMPRLERLHIAHSEGIKRLYKLYKALTDAWHPRFSASEDPTSGPRHTLGHLTLHHDVGDESESEPETDSEHTDSEHTNSEQDTDIRSEPKEIIKGFLEEHCLQGEPSQGPPTRALELRFVRHILRTWLFQVPIMFEMLPLSFDEDRSVEILERSSDMEWVATTGPIYHVD
ncbi:hypothetical protein BDN72DRAFT_300658 [Pluteus cervinus]|uniref:Uncharacterized protein n=1 Tax=Pluteus cervinus TaxID=181527 RepID=A0ACD3ADQ7_9AGAR|nr:hypothetical protein BDN72DRAFT_300658 [Pluteus cervinus]